MNLANNTRFCPTKDTVAQLSRGAVAALSAPNTINITCLRYDMSPTSMAEYLSDPSKYLDAIPPAPPSRGIVRSPSAAPRGSGKAAAAGRIAGAVIGVVAAVAIIGAIGWFVVRPRLAERRATGFFKTRELDLPPATMTAAANPLSAAAASMEPGWGRDLYANGGANGAAR